MVYVVNSESYLYKRMALRRAQQVMSAEVIWGVGEGCDRIKVRWDGLRGQQLELPKQVHGFPQGSTGRQCIGLRDGVLK